MLSFILTKVKISTAAIFLSSIAVLYLLINIIISADQSCIFENFEKTNVAYFIKENIIPANEDIIVYKNISLLNQKNALIITNKKLYLSNNNFVHKIILTEINNVEISRSKYLSTIQINSNRIAIQMEIETSALDRFIQSLQVNNNQIKIIA